MKYLFFVQGEGRGHLSQALVLKEKLEKYNHQILGVVIGIDSKNKLPNFFKEQIRLPLFKIASPGFVIDKQGKGIKIIPSVLKVAFHFPLYLKSLLKVKKIIKTINPDALISFYEPLVGNYYRFHKNKKPLFCLGHQYFVHHPSFKFPKKNTLSRWSFLFYNRLNAPHKSIKIALSFTSEKDQIEKKLFICPPLISKEIKNKKIKNNNFILLYILNSGYSKEILAWGKLHPQTKIEVFWDKLKTTNLNQENNINFNYLNREKFITYLADCQAYASTAGFDSISEAAYLQKNILMVPTKKHFEQKCNAQDANRAGLAQSASYFNLDLIIKNKENKNKQALSKFKKWVDNYDDKIIKILENKELFK